MSLFSNIFGRQSEKHQKEDSANGARINEALNVNNPLVEIDKFIPVELAVEKNRVGIIATAVAAGSQPDSQFIIKRIRKLNPEFKRVTLIAASVASGDLPESQFTINKISKKIGR